MQVVEFKGLVDRLNQECRQALENAAGTCVSRLHYEITIEHMLARLLDNPTGDIQLIAKQLEIDPGHFARALEHVIEGFKTGNSGRPQFSELLPELFADAWLIASVELFETSIRSGALFAAFVSRSSFYASGAYTTLLKGLDKAKIMHELAIVAGKSSEVAQGSGHLGGATGPAGAPAGGSAISRFCEDFTAKARDGKIDPVFGRDAEIRQMVDILARRRKNNPICVGDPGVGKTAVVEGLALRVIEGDVPLTVGGHGDPRLDRIGAGHALNETRIDAVLGEVGDRLIRQRGCADGPEIGRGIVQGGHRRECVAHVAAESRLALQDSALARLPGRLRDEDEVVCDAAEAHDHVRATA